MLQCSIGRQPDGPARITGGRFATEQGEFGEKRASQDTSEGAPHRARIPPRQGVTLSPGTEGKTALPKLDIICDQA